MELSYCTNVHPAEDLDGIIDQLHRHAGPVRREAGLDTLGVGLWLPVGAAAELAGDAAARDRLRDALASEGLTLRTVNAFPYTGFHDDVVKLAVYRPDWTTPERLRYTTDCATVLAELLPEGGTGSISTLPLGWRTGWDASADAAAEENLRAVVGHLRGLEARTGRTVRLAIEPEPGCILDNVSDVVAWLGARPSLVEDGYVGLCLDTCHLAVSFADPVGAVAAATAAGVWVVKVQASVALEVPDPGAPGAMAALEPFAEARYVHQVRAQPVGGAGAGAEDFGDVPQAAGVWPDAGDAADAERPLAADDLVDVLRADPPWPVDRPWRVHVHVPLHARPAEPLRATTEVLAAAVAAVLDAPHGEAAHLDVETYTWHVLPDQLQPTSLVEGIAAELRWATEHLGAAVHPTAVHPTADAADLAAAGTTRTREEVAR
ncbi:metabolite traffic protein EboE [Georgenia sp. Z1344]|uniref:metabolite traffic protein EboE n=1 Tax=Georgenia sp. Z1344 TaxID=3416706 RepID=UPI003CF93C0D